MKNLEIVNLFNDHYNPIAVELDDNIPATNTDPCSFINYF